MFAGVIFGRQLIAFAVYSTKCFLQNSLIRSDASTSVSSGAVMQSLTNPSRLKHSLGKTKTLCSLASARMKSMLDDIFGNFVKSIPNIKYIAPFGMIGLMPGTALSIVYVTIAFF